MLPPRVLVIAGSDSSGGAGIQRDLAVLTMLRVRAVSALTAVTAQSDGQVQSAMVLPSSLVRDQIRAAIDAKPVAAIKIGMLGDAAVVSAVAACLADLPGVPVVVDPVLVSTSGTALLDDAGRVALVEELLPRTALLTPNLAEASILLGSPQIGLAEQAAALLRLGPRAVLIKGGHADGAQAADLLLEQSRPPVLITAARLPVAMRGTGCALSSAICAALAIGSELEATCRKAKDFVFSLMSEKVKHQA